MLIKLPDIVIIGYSTHGAVSGTSCRQGYVFSCLSFGLKLGNAEVYQVLSSKRLFSRI